jgi:hypothetical protein
MNSIPKKVWAKWCETIYCIQCVVSIERESIAVVKEYHQSLSGDLSLCIWKHHHSLFFSRMKKHTLTHMHMVAKVYLPECYNTYTTFQNSLHSCLFFLSATPKRDLCHTFFCTVVATSHTQTTRGSADTRCAVCEPNQVSFEPTKLKKLYPKSTVPYQHIEILFIAFHTLMKNIHPQNENGPRKQQI